MVRCGKIVKHLVLYFFVICNKMNNCNINQNEEQEFGSIVNGFGESLKVLAYVFIFSLLSLSMFSLLVTTLNPEIMYNVSVENIEPVEYWLMMFIMQFVFMFMGLISYTIEYNNTGRILKVIHTDFDLTRDVKLGIVGAVALLILNFALTIGMALVSVELPSNPIVDIVDTYAWALYVIVPMMILVALVEELLFRGIIQGIFRKIMSVKKAIVIASAWFGVVHIIAFIEFGNLFGSILIGLPYVLVTIAFGLILGYQYERTKSIVVPVIAHAVYNAAVISIFVHFM